MTPKEAYKKALEWFDNEPKPVAVICRYYEDFYGFIFAPEDPKGRQIYVGGNMVCVDKSRGSVKEEDYSDICEKEYGLFVDLNDLK